MSDLSEKPWNAPFHPAEHLREDFLTPMGMDAEAVAAALHLPLLEVQPFLEERAPLTGALALRLERAFGGTAEYWMAWQAKYDLRRAADAGDPELDSIHRVVPVAAE